MDSSKDADEKPPVKKKVKKNGPVERRDAVKSSTGNRTFSSRILAKKNIYDNYRGSPLSFKAKAGVLRTKT